MINENDLINYVRESLRGHKIVVAIQREPFMHTAVPHSSDIKVEKAAGGAHVLLDGILRKTGGIMVSLASGNADHAVVDKKNRIKVPPDKKAYTLKRIFLDKEILDEFYNGFSNQSLWPLCHAVFVKPIFKKSWWEAYRMVNQKFADAILEEIDSKEAFIWVNDYQLALVPKMLKAANPKLKIGTFWHIPWPSYEIFRILPWKKEILEGLLGSDFIGFHRGYHVENFVECGRRELEIQTDFEPRSITYKNNETKLSFLPAGIDYHDIKERLAKTTYDKSIFLKDFGIKSRYVFVGVDRIDYTKGIPERLAIIDRFLEKYPKYQGQFTYLSIGAPSRVKIPVYRQLNLEIENKTKIINKKYGKDDWQPIYSVSKILPRKKIFSYYQASDGCIVTSLDDGMNLVAKEYAICAHPEKGSLILSKFTGAAKDLVSAILINPYDLEKSADSIKDALLMDKEEKMKRNIQMARTIKENNTYKWAIDFITKTLE